MQPSAEIGAAFIFYFLFMISNRFVRGLSALPLGPRAAARPGGVGAVLSSLRHQVVPGVETLAGRLVGVVAQVVAAGQPLERVEGQLAQADRFLLGDRRLTSRV